VGFNPGKSQPGKVSNRESLEPTMNSDHKKYETAVKRFFAGLSHFQVGYPLGEGCPFFRFEVFKEIWTVLVRIGYASELQEDLRHLLHDLPTPGKEFRVIKEFTTGGTFEGREVIFCVLLSYFINAPDHIDGSMIIALPARGAESLVQAELKKFQQMWMKLLTRDAYFGFEWNQPYPKN
jgi:hypothetical protein